MSQCSVYVKYLVFAAKGCVSCTCVCNSHTASVGPSCILFKLAAEQKGSCVGREDHSVFQRPYFPPVMNCPRLYEYGLAAGFSPSSDSFLDSMIFRYVTLIFSHLADLFICVFSFYLFIYINLSVHLLIVLTVFNCSQLQSLHDYYLWMRETWTPPIEYNMNRGNIQCEINQNMLFFTMFIAINELKPVSTKTTKKQNKITDL